MLKTIILERISEEGIEIFKSFSDVLEYYEKSTVDIYKKISEFDIVIIKSTVKINKKFLEHSENLKVIARAGTGLDNIDLKEVKKRNIKIISVRRGNTIATAEYVITLILLLLKKIFQIEQMIKKNDYARHKIYLEELSSMNVGIVGMGNLGIELSLRLKNFGCKLLSYDPFSNKKKKFSLLGGKILENLDSLLKKSDIVVMAASLNHTSINLINRQNIDKLKVGSYLINCARAKLIDNDALLEALDNGRVNLAAIDIVDPEPLYQKKKQQLHPIVRHSKVFYSPHVAAMTQFSQKKIAISLGKKVRNYMLMKNK